MIKPTLTIALISFSVICFGENPPKLCGGSYLVGDVASGINGPVVEIRGRIDRPGVSGEFLSVNAANGRGICAAVQRTLQAAEKAANINSPYGLIFRDAANHNVIEEGLWVVPNSSGGRDEFDVTTNLGCDTRTIIITDKGQEVAHYKVPSSLASRCVSRAKVQK